MSSTYKVTVSNLADVRSELRLTLEEMAKAMDVTRQTVASIEGGDPKDSRFVQKAFDNLRESVAAKFAVFRLEAEDGQKDKLRIVYSGEASNAQSGSTEKSLTLSGARGAIDVDPDDYMIMRVTSRVRTSRRTKDGFVTSRVDLLEDLRDALREALG